jgi:hypothetical protein
VGHVGVQHRGSQGRNSCSGFSIRYRQRSIPVSTRYELRELLRRLQTMDPDDTKAVTAWRRIREAAPKVWEATKPVRDAIIGEMVKRTIGP